MQFETLPGFREFLPEACSVRNAIFRQWRASAGCFNFLEYDAPVLEPLELYIEKSGAEIVGQLFNFEDRGGRAVALRPEMTPSLARLVGARANSLKRPVKWFNIGEHYRYERPQKGRLRAFYQFNADILGEPGPAAEAELIALLVHTLRGFGLGQDDFRIRLSDRDLWWLMLAAEGLDEDQSTKVLGIIDKMEKMDRARLLEKLGEVLGAGAEAFCLRIDTILEIKTLPALREFITGLPLAGEHLDAARSRMEDWQSLMNCLKCAGVEESICVDLGIVRGLAYYTGFVFEAFEISGAGRALAGGGRYDDLVRKLGGPDMPAVGFAMGDVTLGDLLESKSRLPDVSQSPDFIMVIGGSDERPLAMEDAARLRGLGFRVDYPLKEQNFGKQLKAANQSGARFALIYGSNELAAGVVRVRDLSMEKELDLLRSNLIDSAGALLANGLKALPEQN